MWREARVLWGLAVALWLAGASAVASSPSIGYCTCSGSSCRMVVGYDSMGYPIWQTVSSCPSSGSGGTRCQTRYRTADDVRRLAEQTARLMTSMRDISQPPPLEGEVPPDETIGHLTYEEFCERGLKVNKTGRGVKLDVTGLPGELEGPKFSKPAFATPREAWEYYKRWKKEQAERRRALEQESDFELPRADIRLRYFASVARTSFRRTRIDSDISVVGGKEVESKALSQSYAVISSGRLWSLAVEATVEREEHDSDFDGLDNTSLRLMVAPIHHLLRREVHGFDLNVGCNVGYQHTWYDEDSELDKPVGTRWGMGEFRNPDLFTLGAMVGAVVPWRLGETALAASYQWGLDLHRDGMLAGNDHLDYLTVLGRHSVHIYRNLYAALQGTLAHTNDVPAGWDNTTCSGAVEVGWRERLWRLGCSLRRDFADSNISEWACVVDFSMTW